MVRRDLIEFGEDIVAAAKSYVASQGFPSAQYVEERLVLVVHGVGGVTHFVHLAGLRDRWADADEHGRRRMLERRLLGLRAAPDKVTDELLAHRLLPRLRTVNHLKSLTLHRQIIERADQEPSPELTLPFVQLNEELGVQLVFELSEESADVNDARVASWGRPVDALMKLALEHLRRRSSEPMQQIKPRLWASTVGDGHDAARLLLEDRISALPLKGELVAMAPHFDLLLVCSADDTAALIEMAKLGLQASQQPFGVSGVAMIRGAEGWKPWMPPVGHAAHEALRTARLPVASRSYGRQKELLEAWFDLEGEQTLVAPMIIVEEQDKLFSGAVWLKGNPSLLPHAERIAFAIPDAGENARVYPVPWDQAVKLPGIHLQPLPNYSPRRYRATGFPEPESLEQATKRS